MSIHTMKATTFDKADTAQWMDAAIQTLKGKAFESLCTETTEGIVLQPLYTIEDLESRKQTNRVSKNGAGWIVAQQTIAIDGQQFIENLKKSIDRGNEAIFYDGTTQLQWSESALTELAQLMEKHPVIMLNTDKQDPVLNAFSFIPEAMCPAVKGALSVSDWSLSEKFPNIRIFGADLWTAHHKGADAVTELALALAQAATYAEKKAEFSDFANEYFVRFAVDTHFFMEIAKFRAFRVLWQAFGTAYDVAEVPAVPMIATTSLRSYSKLDPYVNLLRAGNGAFSAVLGGADVITVHPHDLLTGPSESSARFARNIQLVIKEETHADKVIDPAGGSYFLESLTAELVEKAWALFLDIEADGGYDTFMASGRMAALLEERRIEVATGRKSLIGTNVYAELTDPDLEDWNGIQTEGRLAEPFEKLRSLFSNEQPQTVLLTFGELKAFKPRADFVGGFLATGGIRSEWSPAFEHAKEAIDWLRQEKPDYAIVCASPVETETIMTELLTGLPESVVLDVAGNYDAGIAQQWLDKGLNGFIFAGQDKVGKLKDIHSKWKGGVSVE